MIELLSLFGIFQAALKILQTGNDMSSHLVLMLYDELVNDLHEKAIDVKFIPLLYDEARRSFEKRVKIGNHFIVAAMLDPGQIHLAIIPKYLAKIDKTFVEVLEEVANQIGLEGCRVLSQQISETSQQKSVDLVTYFLVENFEI